VGDFQQTSCKHYTTKGHPIAVGINFLKSVVKKEHGGRAKLFRR